MPDSTRLYIDGAWITPTSLRLATIENPATERAGGQVALGSPEDVELAVRAARRAFSAWSQSSREYRIALLDRIVSAYDLRSGDLAAAITEEMGCPAGLSRTAQVPIGRAHFATALEILRSFAFEEDRGPTRILREPIGVCALITPWNWPLNQIACKVAPALAAGCTMILKPSEIAPGSATILAEILDDAGVPPGVFNLVHGDGRDVGAALSSHPDVDMVSFTGSNAAGVQVAIAAAPTVKRVHQELGGKSPCIVLDDEDLANNVAATVAAVMLNSGQSCNAPTRLLVPANRMAEATAAARAVAERQLVGDPAQGATMGPVVSRAQWDRIQTLITRGQSEGATLIAGGPGRPENLIVGHYVKPTVFAQVDNDMTIARQEIFGPVAAILAYETVDDAVRDRERYAVRPLGLWSRTRSGGLSAHRRPLACGTGVDQWCRRRLPCPVRRLPSQWQRSGVGRSGLSRVPGNQGRAGVQ